MRVRVRMGILMGTGVLRRGSPGRGRREVYVGGKSWG